MPTLPYLTDTSTQLSGTYTTSTAALDNFVSSNYVNFLSSNNSNYTRNASNILKSFIDTTNTNLTATNTNLANNYYNKTSTDTLLNAKEQILSFTAPLTRSTNTISINLSSYSTTGSDPSFVLKTGSTMTGALLNTSSTASEFKGIYFNHPTRITHIPYLPDGNIYFRAPVIIDNSADYLSFGSRIGDNIIRLYGTDFGFGINGATLRYNVPTGSVHRFYHGTTNTAWIDDTGRLKATTFEGSGASLTNVPYTALTGTVPFYTKAEEDALLLTNRTNNSNYTKEASNVLKSLIDTTNTNLSTNYYNKTSTDTLLNAKEQILTFSSPLTRSTNTIGINLSSYSTTGSDPSFVLKSGSTMTGALTVPNITLGSNGKINSYDDYHYIQISQPTDTLTIQEFGTISFNIGITKTQVSKINSTGLTVYGICTATTFAGSGASLTNVPYSALTGTVPFYTKTENDNLLNAKEQILTFSSPLTRSTNTIGINLGSYSTSGTDPAYVLKTGSTMTGTLTGTTINATTALQEAGTNLTSKYLVLAGGTLTGTLTGTTINASTNLQEGTVNLSAKYLRLIGGTLTGTLTGTTINATTALQEAGTNLTSKYLALAGGTMTGQLFLTTSAGNNPIYISSTSTTANNCINIKNNSTYNAYIGVGGSAFTGNYQNNFFIESASSSIVFNTNGRTSGSAPNMFINTSGNVGIGTASPNALLTLYGTTQVQPKLSLTGIEYYTGTNTNGDGVGLLLGVNRSDNRQLWFCDTAKTAINTTNTVVRVVLGTETPTIDAIATDGITRKPFNIGGSAITITALEYPALRKMLGFSGISAADDVAFVNDLIFNKGAVMAGVFAGDMCISNYWGVSILLNSGGTANGYGGDDAGRTYDYGWASFNVLMRNSGSSTFNRRLFTVRPNGQMMMYNDIWHTGLDGNNRFYFATGGRTYYQGFGQYTTDYNHEWKNHNGAGVMFLGYTGTLLLNGEIVPTMTSVSSLNTDYCGVSFNSAINGVYQTSIKILFQTFTGMHRCFTEDELYDEDEPQKFKDDYVGRIVVSTGKIATDTKTENEIEWDILYDKEGITIEDALPIIQLSRKKKDKRVFGVLGSPSRNNSRAERMIVNSVGEGAIYVINSNGNIENGDYIQSSDYLGYGEKQDEIFLANYTVAKATMDCNFELDIPLYQCFELDNGLRVAFIACTYHSG